MYLYNHPLLIKYIFTCSCNMYTHIAMYLPQVDYMHVYVIPHPIHCDVHVISAYISPYKVMTTNNTVYRVPMVDQVLKVLLVNKVLRVNEVIMDHPVKPVTLVAWETLDKQVTQETP